MADLSKLHQLLDWKLLKGSHEFPGPDGGTCINEAAIVAAGFEYRRVQGVRHFPDCFSRPLGHLLMALNDVLDENARQLLKPFVLKLAGSNDSDAVERQRLKHILHSIEGIVTCVEGRHEFQHPRVRATAIVLNQASQASHGSSDFKLVTERIALAIFYLHDGHRSYLPACLQAISEAFDIGNKADPLDLALVQERMDAAKKAAKAAAAKRQKATVCG